MIFPVPAFHIIPDTADLRDMIGSASPSKTKRAHIYAVKIAYDFYRFINILKVHHKSQVKGDQKYTYFNESSAKMQVIFTKRIQQENE
jgi:hypothetical protein